MDTPSLQRLLIFKNEVEVKVKPPNYTEVVASKQSYQV
ncbi:hypothetical protein TMUPMC115_1267 [Tetragenococcus muriaticus PMC-11-5]|uniref:Uncharacterized protein n=2 Tax=Tetragenococcus muriaticus TaxID=64642 RepID=A0A091C010_9ENTE|nr:hypothetical protein TMU3MR103_1128 [Tetragenococcus muriaticus 3MR10-3]KFN91648.1 hypothetical protein TMUPMC115_1267 [Tetragenococcus muriaticus PMC-11-5]